MLNTNYTYDNRNLRDKQKMFNAGVAYFYNAEERVKCDLKGKFYFSKESVSLNSYLNAKQNNTTVELAIGIPESPIIIEHGDIAIIDDEEYMVTYSQYQDYEYPHWYKVYLERNTIPYETMD